MSRISNYMSFQNTRILLKAVVESQFGYCPLAWLFHSRKSNFKINHIHEWTLRMVCYGVQRQYFLLWRNTKERQILLYKSQKHSVIGNRIFKGKNNLSNWIICDIFETRNWNYNLRSQKDFIRTRVNASNFVLNSLKYLATKI